MLPYYLISYYKLIFVEIIYKVPLVVGSGSLANLMKLTCSEGSSHYEQAILYHQVWPFLIKSVLTSFEANDLHQI
jgi:hypothetical protein